MIFQKISTISYFTFREIWKSKILLNVLFVGLGLILTTVVATEFTFGVPERVALDFGMGMLSLSSLAISIFLGVGLLSKEIDSRTVYMVISRPVPRYAFIIGKICGLMGIQCLNVLILSAMTLVTTKFLGGAITSLVLWSIFYTLLESLLALLLVILISLLANNILTVLFSTVLLILGHAIRETQEISFVKSKPLLLKLLEIYHFALPGFYKLNIKEFLLYKTELPLSYLLNNTVYALTYSGFLLLMIILIFDRKNLD
jgi:ABC-type transport system involved in multi-copper enzyme maturation permease subunit